MRHQSIGRRLAMLKDNLNPRPDDSFLAYARALIEFGGHEPTAESTQRLAELLYKER